MNKSQMRMPPGFLLIFSLAIFALLGWLVVSGVPTEREKAKAKVLETLVEERSMGELLKEKASKVGGLTNIPNEFILNPFLVTNKYSGISFATRTNALGELIDFWQTPFQIKFAEQTNFIIRSAGPNRIFGDADDIIFNSASNDIVMP
jgi:hypothetical protein